MRMQREEQEEPIGSTVASKALLQERLTNGINPAVIYRTI